MKIKVLRRIIQDLSILLIIAIPILNKKGITILMGNFYSLSISGIWMTDPLSGFQVILSTLSMDMKLFMSMLIPTIIALIFGRVFCSWMCPQNTLSELFDYISRRLPHLYKSNNSPSSGPRYILLSILIISAPLAGFPVANLISAPGIISLQVSKYIYEGTIGLEIGLIGIIILMEISFIRRLWCNYICPVGSFLGLFRFKRTMKVIYREDAEHTCGKCMECMKACQLGLNPTEGEIYPLCHNCGDCISACEEIKDNAKPLSFKF
ncbi:MAG: quinol dehydrogenase ferredoxin subunit NapH [Thermodesulfovibrionia bacterium]